MRGKPGDTGGKDFIIAVTFEIGNIYRFHISISPDQNTDGDQFINVNLGFIRICGHVHFTHRKPALKSGICLNLDLYGIRGSCNCSGRRKKSVSRQPQTVR